MNEMIERLWRRLVAVVGPGRVAASDDSGPVQVLQVRHDEWAVQDDVPRLVEYGMASNPPPGTDVLVVRIAGSATDAAVIATGNQAARPRGLAVGEVMLYDNLGRRVYLSAGGVRVDAGDAPVTVTTSGACTFNVGALVVNGDTTFNGSVTANGHRIDETHTHPLPGGGTTLGVS